ncbi:KGGVGR-motif variant AAA ATPase [Nocardia sp. NRRL S-836]|uniref:KGGVGR-motif variant AAA ATPase n=1 Tax=Nocardia sp. NRRL S-836 TaxID=1519492 RepID=UPI0018D0DEA4|nr:tetratricopeptide repeat protein [Nocardia sp. NRRL S-836]
MIVTFYSYKGGVGRSFCLANVAVQLARWGNRVLCVDFDLDAPGLHEYFRPFLRESPARGLVEVVEGEVEWRDAVSPVVVPEAEGLALLAAGRMDETYADRAQALSWPELFAHHDLGWRFEKIRQEWAAEFDHVLIDSRTGITDIGGICTAQLPEVLVLCVAPNQQNLDGTLDVARRAAVARDKLPYDRAGLLYLPVVSRFDGREEYERARSWRSVLAEKFAGLYSSWMPADNGDAEPELGLVERTTVPYLPYWSFGEEIAVVDERSGNPDTVSYYMDNIAALLAHGLADADVLVSARDTYVSAARERGNRSQRQGYRYDVLVHGTSERAIGLTEELAALGVRAVRGRLAELSMARHFVIVDPPARPSVGIQEILDQAQLDSGRLVVAVVEAEADGPRQLASVRLVYTSADAAGLAVTVAGLLPGAGARWERVLVAAASVLLGQGDVGGAFALATRAAGSTGRPVDSLLLRGRLAHLLGRFDDARDDLQAVLNRVPRHSTQAHQAYRLLGAIHRDSGDFGAAVTDFGLALSSEAAPRDHALVHRDLARIALLTGDYEAATAHFEDAQEVLGAADAVLAAELAFELGSLRVDRGEFAQALDLLSLALESGWLGTDDRVTALRQLAYLHTQAREYESAAGHLRQALTLGSPGDVVDIAVELAQVQREAHGTDAANDELEAVLGALDPADRRSRARLREAQGNLQLDSGDVELAVTAFESALTTFRGLGDRAGEVRALIGLAGAFQDRDYDRAFTSWDEARRLLTRLRGSEADLLRRQLDAVDPR